MNRVSIYLLISILLLLAWKPVEAQTSDQLADVEIAHTYGIELTFSARVMQPANIKDIFLFFEVEGEKLPRGSLIVVDSNGLLNFTYDVKQTPIRPFANITYWYSFNMESGETFKSKDYYFQYTDNRFSWKTLKSDSVVVNWYSGDMDFGQDGFDILHQSILRISNLISISLGDPIQLYLYATQDDLQSGLALGGQATIDPEMQVLMIWIAPGADQKVLMGEQIPYELTHLLLYRKTGLTNDLLPVWLKEGIATQVENSPNPNFDYALANAMEKQNLIPLRDLCASFPQDPESIILASAQANSFTSYLYSKYNPAGIERLIQAYTAPNSDCEQGAKSALGKTLTQLEFDWLQETFNKNALWQTIINFLPYLFILLLVLLIPLLNKPKKVEAET